MNKYYSIQNNELHLTVHIKTKAKVNSIIGIQNGRLKIQINALPVKGEANKKLIAFLADLLQVTKKQITILKGTSNSNKLLVVKNINYLPQNLPK